MHKSCDKGNRKAKPEGMGTPSNEPYFLCLWAWFSVFLGFRSSALIRLPGVPLSLKPNVHLSHLKGKSRETVMTDLRYPIGKFKYEGPPTEDQKQKYLGDIERAPAHLRAAI